MAGVFVPQMQQRDSLGEVLKGLQVASTGFGIYKDFQGLQDRKDQMDLQKQAGDTAQLKAQDEIARKGAEDAAKEKVAGGYLDMPEQSKMAQSGWRPGTAQDKGAIQFTARTPSGDQPVFYVPPMSESDKFSATQAATAKKENVEKLVSQEKDKKTQENILRKEWGDDDTTKTTRSIVEARDKIKSLIESNRTTGANGLAIIYANAKVLDPGGRVTDSDFQAGKNLSGPLAKLRNYYDYVFNGDPLREDDKKSILVEVEDMYKSQLDNQMEVDDHYRSMSEHYNLNSANILPTRYSDRLQKFKEGRSSTGTVSSNRISLPGNFGEATASPADVPFDIDAYNSGRP